MFSVWLLIHSLLMLVAYFASIFPCLEMKCITTNMLLSHFMSNTYIITSCDVKKWFLVFHVHDLARDEEHENFYHAFVAHMQSPLEALNKILNTTRE